MPELRDASLEARDEGFEARRDVLSRDRGKKVLLRANQLVGLCLDSGAAVRNEEPSDVPRERVRRDAAEGVRAAALEREAHARERARRARHRRCGGDEPRQQHRDAALDVCTPRAAQRRPLRDDVREVVGVGGRGDGGRRRRHCPAQRGARDPLLLTKVDDERGADIAVRDHPRQRAVHEGEVARRRRAIARLAARLGVRDGDNPAKIDARFPQPAHRGDNARVAAHGADERRAARRGANDGDDVARTKAARAGARVAEKCATIRRGECERGRPRDERRFVLDAPVRVEREIAEVAD